MSEHKAVELYRKHRPTKFSDLVGQSKAVSVLLNLAKRNAIPQFLLLIGPSGCGKTTIARIIRKKLKCGDADFIELNAADERGIDIARDIKKRMGFKPISGPCRVWLLDEAHQLTSDAQSVFLKMLEDTPRHVHFIFCTTDPGKLKNTIITRATIVKLEAVGRKDLKDLVHRVAEGETGVGFSEEVSDKIVDFAEGSPRRALTLLGQVLWLEDEEKQVEALVSSEQSNDAVEICKKLINPKTSWNEVAGVLKGIKNLNDEAENIRYLVLSWMSSVALNGGKQAGKAVDVIVNFEESFIYSKRAGLIRACYDAVAKDKS